MEPIFYTSAGAAGVIGLIILRLAARHGWAWVAARLAAKAQAAEADVKARFDAAAAPFEARVKALEASVAAIKAKVGA